MKNTRNLSRLAALGFAIALAGTAPALLAHAQDTEQNNGSAGYSMGPGMMQGYAHGGYGMGPGMMGGYGMGPGMMGGYGMGPGMMGGYGMGPGMMGGYGMGPGMMMGGMGMMHGWGGPGAFLGHVLDLSAAQQAKINKITDETRKAQWSLMGAMMDQQAAMRDLYASSKPDDSAMKQVYGKFNQLQQQMFNNMLDAQKRIDAVLTKEQREKLRTFRRGCWQQ